MNNFYKKVIRFFSSFLFDPISLLYKWRAIPIFILNTIKYNKNYKNADLTNFYFDISNMYFTTQDKYLPSGIAQGHYFHQDLWAAKKIFESNISFHIDIGSRIDGFIAHILPFCKVEYVDIRNLTSKVENLYFKQASILSLPYKDKSIDSLSCLHVIEHIGLGRYGDDIDSMGHIKAAKELTRVLATGGKLYLGTPIGKEKLCFDAHRIFNPNTVIEMFAPLKLIEFNLIDDNGSKIHFNASFEDALKCKYGCGLFIFTKV